MSRGFETQARILIMLQKTSQGPPLKMSVIYVRFYQGVLAPESHEWADNLYAAAGCQ